MTTTNFEEATITFKIDQSQLNDTNFDNLIILWYNEEAQIFEEMETIRDSANSTVSTTTTHFSQYMVVDSIKWYENWNNSLNELRKMWIGNTSYQKNLHTILMVDCSTSMRSTDYCSKSLVVGYNGVTEDNIEDIRLQIDGPDDESAYCVNWCKRATICNNIINSKGINDCAAVIAFSDSILFDSGFSYNKSYLKNKLPDICNGSGIANLNIVLNTALNHVVTDTTDLYRLVVITDSGLRYTNISSDDFADNVILNIVNIGDDIPGEIERVAQETGGDVYNGITADELTYQSGELVTSPEQFIGTDSDEDGIPDLVELYGLKPNGQPINTNPYLSDTDGDEIADNVELCYLGGLTSNVNLEDYIKAVKFDTDPNNPDADNDGFVDGKDIDPFTFEYVNGLGKLCDIAIKYMPDDFYNSQLLVLQVMRKDCYNNTFWNKTDGSIDENFISYLRNYPDVYYAFLDRGNENRIYMNDPVSSDSIDIAHWAATINAFYYDTEINIDKLPKSYNVILNVTADMCIDNFAGWLGDYLSLLFNLSDEEIKDKNIVYNKIGEEATLFDYSDVLSDFDALNIYYQNMFMNSTISDAFNEYYKNLDSTSKRFGNFAYNLMVDNGFGMELKYTTEHNLSGYRNVFDKVMNMYIAQDFYVAFNGVLLFNNDYGAKEIQKLFRDKETIESTSSAFADYVFINIANVNDIKN